MLSVGINASPLAAPRTGVGRYISGLLAAFEQVPDPGVRVRPLFAPAKVIRSPRGFTARAFATLRAVAKRLPAAYELADTARAAVLAAEQQRGLTLYHETNHAAPPFRGTVVLTVHDLSTLIVPQTEEPARICSAPGCATTLSIYNLSSKCWQHADLKFPTYRGKRLAQGEA